MESGKNIVKENLNEEKEDEGQDEEIEWKEKEEGSKTCIKDCLLNPQNVGFRILMGFLLLFLPLGAMYCYDSAVALQNNIMDGMVLSNSQFTLLYAIFAWPNTVLVYIGGILIDKYIGLRWGCILYNGMVLTGHFLFAFGAFLSVYWLMLLGRFIFGIGTECIQIVQAGFNIFYFREKDINFLIGFQFLIARSGSFFCLYTMEPILQHYRKHHDENIAISFALVVSGLSCIISMTFSVAVVILDWSVDDRLNSTAFKYNKTRTVNLLSLNGLNIIYWLGIFAVMTYYVNFTPFVSISKKFFITSKELDASEANQLISILYISAAIGGPLWALCLHLTGRYIMWASFSLIGATFSFIFICFTNIYVYPWVVIYGLSHALLTNVILAALSFVGTIYYVGITYGILQGLQNFGIGTGVYTVGQMLDFTSNYYYAYAIIFIWLIFCILTVVLMWVFDHRRNGFLFLKRKDVRVYLSRRKLEPSELNIES